MRTSPRLNTKFVYFSLKKIHTSRNNFQSLRQYNFVETDDYQKNSNKFIVRGCSNKKQSIASRKAMNSCSARLICTHKTPNTSKRMKEPLKSNYSFKRKHSLTHPEGIR